MTTAVITQRALRSSRLVAVTLVVAAAALTALAAQWSFHLPFTPVPIPGPTFAVLLPGAALGWRLGAAGSGWEVMRGATGGYIVGFVFAAALVGWAAERGHDRRFGSTVVSFLAGSAVIYVFGILGLMAATGFSFPEAISRGVVPFLVGDLVKAIAAGAILPGAWWLLGERR